MSSHVSVDSSARTPIALARATETDDTIDEELPGSKMQRWNVVVESSTSALATSVNVPTAYAVRHDRRAHASPAERSIERLHVTSRTRAIVSARSTLRLSQKNDSANRLSTGHAPSTQVS